MYRNLLTLVLVLAVASIASAGNATWKGTVDNDVMNAANWDNDGVAALPDADDTTWIRFEHTQDVGKIVPVVGTGDVLTGGNDLLIGIQDPPVGWALIEVEDGAMNVGSYMALGMWNADGKGQVNQSGGTVTVGSVGGGSAAVAMGSDNAYGLYNMTGGTLVTRDLMVARTNSVSGVCNLYGGAIVLDETLGSDPTWPAHLSIGPGGLLNIHAGTLTIDGDWTDVTDPDLGASKQAILDAIAAGQVLAYGQTDGTIIGSETFEVHVDFNPMAGSTTFSATPEPATIALLGLGGLLLRRKR